jgi:hypothetical protein
MSLSGQQTQYSVNNPSPISQLRAPRGFVLLNSINVPWESFEVSNSRYSSASTFRVTIPVSSLPKTLPLPILLQSSPLKVQINGGIPQQVVANNATPSDVPLLVLGSADDLKLDIENTHILISGRDYVAYFQEKKVKATIYQAPDIDLASIQNLTSSQVVTQLATTNSLSSQVTNTTTQVGVIFQNNAALLNSLITEWDLIVFLARQENFDTFVIGSTLYFQPRSSTALPYQITIAVPYYTTTASLPVTNVEQITFTRNYRLAKNIIVNVSSWNINDKVTYNATATLIHKVTLPKDTQTYYFQFANLSQDQCKQKAQALLQEISQHEMTVNIRMPADNLVTPQSSIAVKGTGTIFDQSYYVKNITREMNFNGGFTMNIEANNQTPYSVTISNATD